MERQPRGAGPTRTGAPADPAAGHAAQSGVHGVSCGAARAQHRVLRFRLRGSAAAADAGCRFPDRDRGTRGNQLRRPGAGRREPAAGCGRGSGRRRPGPGHRAFGCCAGSAAARSRPGSHRRRPQPPPPPPPPPSAAAQLAARLFEALDAHDLDAAASLWHPDVVEDFPTGTCRGRDAVRAEFAGFIAAMPDFSIRPLGYLAEGDLAVVRWRATGTHTGTKLQGLRATGARLEFAGADLIEVRNGPSRHRRRVLRHCHRRPPARRSPPAWVRAGALPGCVGQCRNPRAGPGEAPVVLDDRAPSLSSVRSGQVT